MDPQKNRDRAEEARIRNASQASTSGVRNISVSNLNVDHTYQQDVKTKLVNDIYEHLDPDLLGVIKVSLRADGSYWIIDGQHRYLAVRNSGQYLTMRCEVHTGLTVPQEAHLFNQLNTRRKTVNTFNRFKSGIQAGHLDALFVQRVLTEVGLVVVPPKAKQPGEISALEPVIEMGKTYDALKFKGVMQLISDLSLKAPASRDLVVGIRFIADRLTTPLIGGRAEQRIRDIGRKKLVEDQQAFLKLNNTKNGSLALGMGILSSMNYKLTEDRMFLVNVR